MIRYAKYVYGNIWMVNTKKKSVKIQTVSFVHFLLNLKYPKSDIDVVCSQKNNFALFE